MLFLSFTSEFNFFGERSGIELYDLLLFFGRTREINREKYLKSKQTTCSFCERINIRLKNYHFFQKEIIGYFFQISVCITVH